MYYKVQFFFISNDKKLKNKYFEYFILTFNVQDCTLYIKLNTNQ